jgi:hypothetical protein
MTENKEVPDAHLANCAYATLNSFPRANPQEDYCVSIEVLMAVNMKSTAFWAVTPCSLEKS